MQLYCPPCGVAFAGTSHCPKCGGRLLAPQESFVLSGTPKSPPPEAINPTLFGRVFVGSVLGLLLANGLREVAADAPQVRTEWILFVVHAVGTILGGLLAGAGRWDGLTVGAVVGAVVGGSPGIAAWLTGEPLPVAWWVSAVAFVGLAGAGAVAGALGGRVWPPNNSLPELMTASSHGSSLSRLAEEELAKKRTRPTRWVRIMVAVLIAVAGVMATEAIRYGLNKGSFGLLKVLGTREASTVGFQIAVFLLPLAGAVAGAGSGSGLRHGFFAGLIAAAGLFVASLGNPDASFPAIEGAFAAAGQPVVPLTNPTAAARILGGMIVLCTAGGWLGGQLFPAPAGGGTPAAEAEVRPLTAT